MSFNPKYRVLETVTSMTGTGTYTLAGAVTGYQAFSAVGDGNTCTYVAYAVDGNGNPNGDWEVGIGTYTASGTTLARTAILASSNSGSAVNWVGANLRIGVVNPINDTIQPGLFGGRLSLTTGVPVTTSDVTGATDVYAVPFLHNKISLYNATTGLWSTYTFSNTAIALGTLSNATNYDIFAYLSGGSVTYKIGPAWSSGTSRGTGAGTTELVQQDGAWVNAVNISSGPNAKEGLYLGSFRTTATTTTEDSAGGTTTQVGGKRFLWNMFNRVERTILVKDTADSWSYSTNTFRIANGASSPSNCVEFLYGLVGDPIEAFALGIPQGSSVSDAGVSGIGIDSSTNVSQARSDANVNTTFRIAAPAYYLAYPGLGYHYIAWLENTRAGTLNWAGDLGGTNMQSGMKVMVRA